MKFRSLTLATASVAATLAMGTGANAATEIQFWHAMGGELGAKVQEIADKFNASQADYKVVPVFKGTYTETMTGAITAFRAKQQPHIVQVFEVGTATMMAAQGAVYPVYQLMADAKLPFDAKSYLQAVSGYYTDTNGNMLSMPFNSSTPVLYYNKTAFAKAGLDPNTPPKTWKDVETYSEKLLAAGYKCGFSTGWMPWVQMETFLALHNQPIGTKGNGFGGLDTELTVNGPLELRHITNMAEWAKKGIFKYTGRRSDGAPSFYNEECTMYMNSSGGYAGVKVNAKTFEFGVGMLPYYDDVKGAPQNSIIGGAALWVLKGHKAEDYKGVGQFFNFISKPEIQADWHQVTGYLPITTAAYELSKAQGFYDRNPGTDMSVRQINLNPPTENSKGLRFGNYAQIRDVIDEELEGVWSGQKTPKDALDSIVKRGNDLLRKFEKTNG